MYGNVRFNSVCPGPPDLTIDRIIFEMWLGLDGSPKSATARS